MPIMITVAPSGRVLVLTDRHTRERLHIPMDEVLEVGSRLIQEARLIHQTEQRDQR